MKFHLLLIKLWLRTEKIIKILQSKGNNSCKTSDTLMKLHVHNHTIVIYIQYKLNEISSVGYKVMAEDRKIIEI